MTISIPNLSFVVLIGPSGSGKSTFAQKHFLPTEILSSDACRGMVCDNENDQAVTNEAFEVLHYIARKRLALGKLTVVDATNVQPEARKPLVQLAREHHCLPVALVFNLPERVCEDRNRGRATVVYGHTPVPEAEWLNRTTNIDTGCVFGGKLTALRWPEREFVSVPAARAYCEPARPFLATEDQASLSAQQIHDDLLDADDVLGKRIISTRLRSNVTIREENAPVPPPGDRGEDPHRPGSRLAHGDAGNDLPPRSQAPGHDAVQGDRSR
jgi:predicted kinase